jgi:hypothetical protein
MKKNLLLASAFVLTGQFLEAQMVSGGAYLHGNYVEVGIDSLGGYEGINAFLAPVPAGFHQRGPTNLFGFVANPQKDLWVNYDGDFYTPGSPENGWGLEIYDTTATDTTILKIGNNCGGSGFPIPGYTTGHTHTGGVTTVTWHGDYVNSPYDLDVDIVYTLGDTDLFYTTQVTIFNNGPANIEKLYYFRSMDPDNNETINSDFTTANTIVSQGSTSSQAIVKAEQSLPWTSMVSFFSTDTSARVTYGGFSNRSGSEIWNATGGLIGTIGTHTADEAISLAFYQPSFNSFTRSGGTYQRTFSFQTVFSANALAALIAGASTSGIDNTIANNELSTYPNPTTGNVTVTCSKGINRAVLYNNMGSVTASYSNVNSTSMQLDLSKVENGIYLLVIENAQGKLTRKLVKQ